MMIPADPPKPERTTQEAVGLCDGEVESSSSFEDRPQPKSSEQLIGSDASSKKSTREESAATCLTEEHVPAPKIAEECIDSDAVEESGRERLKRHRMEMAGRVWIPEIWGQESLLRDWIDSSVFDRPLVPKGLMSAREALVEECRRTNSGSRQIKNPC